MPHNNRMSTSASLKTHAIWQNTIGHDPYAAPSEAKQEENSRENNLEGKKKLEEVMGMARSQNLTDSANRSGFTAQMYRGLKKGKQRRDEGEKPQVLDPNLQSVLDDLSSSSEEEYVEVEVKREKNKKKSSRKKDKRRTRRENSERKERKRSRSSKTRRRSRNSDESSLDEPKKKSRKDGRKNRSSEH